MKPKHILLLGVLFLFVILFMAVFCSRKPIQAARLSAADLRSEFLNKSKAYPNPASRIRYRNEQENTCQAEAVRRMTNHYEAFFRGPSGAEYSNILAVLQKYGNENATENDLFLDASSYIALRTQADAWLMDDKKLHSVIPGKRLLLKDPERMQNALTGVSNLLARKELEYKILKDSYRRIFEQRISSKCQGNSSELLNELETLTLQPGPELTIPAN